MTRDSKSNRVKRAKRLRAEIDKLLNPDATLVSADDDAQSTPSLRELTDAAAAAAQAEAKSKSREDAEDAPEFDGDGTASGIE